MIALDTQMLSRRVERMLDPWRAAIPGVAVGVVREGALVVQGQAGLASLELDVAIGPETTFRIASVSKQFTCAAILMLAEEGRLGLEDDVRDHLPGFPDLGARIAVSHLMHNTSGIRDMLECMRFGGTDLGTPVATDDLIEAIHRQRGLNFAPGTRYLYSNSNFLLLGRIVERIADEALPAFLEHRIFAPLGMGRTRMTPDVTTPVRGLATGYFPRGQGWVRAPHAFPLGGEGGLVSSVPDLALWSHGLASGRLGDELARGLEQQTPFVNGHANNYARGLQVIDHRGVRTVSHGGSWPGYKTRFLRAPTLDATIVVISNNELCDTYHLAQHVLDAIIDERPGRPSLPSPLLRAELERHAGRWVDLSSGDTLDLEVTASGRLVGRANGVPFRLVAAGDGRLTASRANADFFARLSDDGATLDVEEDAGARVAYVRATPGELPDDLPGTYASDEMAAVWTIAEAGGAMTVRVAGPVVNAGGWLVLPIAEDVVRILIPRAPSDAWLDARVLRDEHEEITGLHVDGGRARGVVFARAPTH